MKIKEAHRIGYNSVNNSIRITYNIPPAGQRITANILKDEAIVGFFNISKDGVTGFSLQENNGLTQEEMVLVFKTALEDSTGVFQEKEESQE